MIYCVEDDASIRDLEVYTLCSTGFAAQGFRDGKELFDAIHKQKPELIVLDIMLPGDDGVQILHRLKNSSELSEIPVIMATAKSMEYDKIKTLDMGADDYITKPFNILEVKARIKAIIRRTAKQEKKADTAGRIQAGDMTIERDNRRVYIEGREINLTAKEFDVLELLATHPNQVYSREKLLTMVWGADYPGDARTVDVHIRRLREKVETNSSEPKYVHTKWGVGYYFKG